MYRIVHAQSYGHHHVNHRNEIDLDIPEVEEADRIDDGEDDAEDDHEADGEVGEEEEGDDEHRGHGQAHVTPHFQLKNLLVVPHEVYLEYSWGRVYRMAWVSLSN